VSAMTWDRLGSFINIFCASEATGARRVGMMTLFVAATEQMEGSYALKRAHLSI
jgi:hypothetical protein